MCALSYRVDQKLIEVLRNQDFTISAEVIPPRNGTDHTEILKQIKILIDSGAQFLSVTKGAGGSLRGGSLPIAHAIKDQFSVPSIAHFTCRDLTPQDVENQLIDHHYFGIRNILALRGDPPDGQKEWKAREGGYQYAYQLIEQIRNLNAGNYLTRPGRPSLPPRNNTDFCIGSAVYPDHDNIQERIEFFKMKVDAGAEYGITDMLFDPESYGRFLDLCEKHNVNVPILPGTRILKSQAHALKMLSKFKVKLPSTVFHQLPERDSPDHNEVCFELFEQLARRLRALGAPGVHVYVISDTEGASSALRRLAESKKKVRQETTS